jgi:hypothetical protein
MRYDIERYETGFNEADWKGTVTALVVHENLAYIPLLSIPYVTVAESSYGSKLTNPI